MAHNVITSFLCAMSSPFLFSLNTLYINALRTHKDGQGKISIATPARIFCVRFILTAVRLIYRNRHFFLSLTLAHFKPPLARCHNLPRYRYTVRRFIGERCERSSGAIPPRPSGLPNALRAFKVEVSLYRLRGRGGLPLLSGSSGITFIAKCAVPLSLSSEEARKRMCLKCGYLVVKTSIASYSRQKLQSYCNRIC
ncbi:MAG: hypothetical protein FWH08_07285 [Oscillospiraceae bacterium]|nr:hypothetical protein [Oscillospiraceae bacterium]